MPANNSKLIKGDGVAHAVAFFVPQHPEYCKLTVMRNDTAVDSVDAEQVANVFTVDVEDYFQVGAFADRIDPNDWDNYECRVEKNTRLILELMAKHSVTGTFFVLGWIAERYPDLVREIKTAGHEIGCHSHMHQLIYQQSPEVFREDLRTATRLLEDIAQQPVTSFRAPSFSITGASQWALDVLIEEGYRYDSSIFPIRHDRYGMPGAERFPHRISASSGEIVEFPPSVYPIWKYHLPVAGGGYFRLFPYWLTARAFRSINRAGRGFMFYIHPWEVDPDQPRLPGTWKSKFRHYQNLRTTAKKLDRLLGDFAYQPMTEVVQRELERN